MIVVEMKKHFQLRALEWWSAGMMASWGIWVLALPKLFEENPAAEALLYLAPQHVWGLAATLAGVLRLGALFVNGMWHRTPAVRWLCSTASVFVWFFVCSTFLKSSITGIGTIIYVWLMVADMYSAFRSASDFVEAEAQKRIQSLSLGTTLSDEGSNVRGITTHCR